MSEQQNSGDNEDQKIREHLVNTALNFLLNPGVIDKPYEHKTAFLKKKGLTDAEISLAYKKAESDPKFSSFQRDPSSSVLPPPVPVYNRPVSFWSQLSNLSSSLILFGVALFGAHYFYKKCIEPLIFGEELTNGKPSKLEEQLSEMASSLSQLEKTVSALEESIKCQKTQMDKYLPNEVYDYYPTPLALKELKSEVGSIKSMLLNRHQFPALPKVTPTIPQWQLPLKSTNGTAEQNDEDNNQQDSNISKVAPTTQQTVLPENDDKLTDETNGDLNNISEVNEILSDKSDDAIINSDLAMS